MSPVIMRDLARKSLLMFVVVRHLVWWLREVFISEIIKSSVLEIDLGVK